MLVLNKRDLISHHDQARVMAAVKRADPDLSTVLFTNCKDNKDKGLKKVRGFSN